MNWQDFAPYFTEEEFRCKHTGKCEMNEDFMRHLVRLRVAYDKPMRITSGYRDKTHPIEIAKGGKSGAHTTGRACDIAVIGADALRLVELAIMYGFTGIGVKQHGEGRFIHLDDLDGKPGQPRPWLWSYA